MKPSMKAAPAIAAAALLALTSACGGSGGSSSASPSAKPSLSASEQKVADKIAAYFVKSASGTLSSKAATCLSEGFVNRAGVATLKKDKLISSTGEVQSTGATFDSSLANKFADSYFECVDYAALQASSIAKADKTVDEAKLKACIAKAVPVAEAKKLIVSSLSQNPDSKLASANVAKLQKCKTSSTKAG